MASRWLYHQGGKSHGPVSSKELAAFAKSGLVKPHTLVKRADDLNWVAARKVRGLFTPSASATLPVPPPLPTTRPASSVSKPAPAAQTKTSKRAPLPIWGLAIGTLGGVLMALIFWFVILNPTPNDQISNAVKVPAPEAAAAVASLLPKIAAVQEDSDQSDHRESTVAPADDRFSPGLLDFAPKTPEAAPQPLAVRLQQSVVTINVEKSNGLVLGSGFFVLDNHTLVTNYHVIEGGTQAQAILPNGKQLLITGYSQLDAGSDLVLLSIEPQPDITPLKVADNIPQQGEEVWAFGSPKGLTSTVSRGIVSAIRRTKELPEALRDDKYNDSTVWIQTDAPISHGSSGGPLVNLRGEVIGVNTFSGTTGLNLNFASSAMQIRDLALASPGTLQPISGIPVVFSPAQSATANPGSSIASSPGLSVSDQQIAAELEKNREAAHREQELNRLTERINRVRADLVEIERQQTSLQRTRDSLASQRDSIWQRGMKLRDQLDDLNAQIKSMNKDINNRLSAIFGPRGNDPAIPGIRRSIASKESQRERVIADGDKLEAQYDDVDEQVKKLDGQLQEKANRRIDLFAEIKTLEARIKALSAQR